MKLQFLKKPFCSSEGHVRTNQSTVHCYCLAALGYGSLLRSKEGCSPLLCNVLVSLGYHHANGIHKCSYHKLNLNTQTNKKFNIAIPTHPMHTFCMLPKSVTKILCLLDYLLCCTGSTKNAWKGNLHGMDAHFYFGEAAFFSSFIYFLNTCKLSV